MSSLRRSFRSFNYDDVIEKSRSKPAQNSSCHGSVKVKFANSPTQKDKQATNNEGKLIYIHVEVRPCRGDNAARELVRKKNKTTRCISSLKIHGAPFNSQTERFVDAGAHPRLYQKSNQSQPSQKREAVSPNKYPEERDSSPVPMPQGWKRDEDYKLKTMKRSQREMRDRQSQLEMNRGPGYYNTPDMKTSKGSWMPKSKRMADDIPLTSVKLGHLHHRKLTKRMVTPGPGTYENTYQQSRHSFREGRCMLDSSLGHDQSLSVNNVPPPGQYKITGFVEKILEKTDTHGACTSWGTTSRSAVINTGCARQLDSIYTFSKDKPSIGPGMYNPKCLHDIKYYRVVKPVSDRHGLLVNVNPPVGNSNPSKASPGDSPVQTKAITQQRGRKYAIPLSAMANAKANRWNEKYGFLSGAKKQDKITAGHWGLNERSISPGRYSMKDQVNRNSHRHVFDSKTTRPVLTSPPADGLIRLRSAAAFLRTQNRLERMKTAARSQATKNSGIEEGYKQSRPDSRPDLGIGTSSQQLIKLLS